MDGANAYVSKRLEFWKSVIFTDETKFYIFGIKGNKLIWRKTGKTYEKDDMVPSVKRGGSGVMVWGCMATNGIEKLTFIDSKMNQRLYKKKFER